MGLAKLDIYDYVILPGTIRVRMDGPNDPMSVDILSEIDKSDGRIYVEGYYYMYLDNYEVHTYTDGRGTYMDLEVVELNRS